MKDAGLESMPGGGAEVFSNRVRRELFPGKNTAERWMEIHRLAHNMGIPPTQRSCTATSRPTRSAYSTWYFCESSRTSRRASWPSSHWSTRLGIRTWYPAKRRR